MSSGGGRPRLLIGGPGGAYDPDVSPGGRKIAFVSKRDVGRDIFVADVSGHHVRKLTDSQDHCSGRGCFFAPAWAPDGKHIAFRVSVHGAMHTARIEVMRANGTRSKQFAFSDRGEGVSSQLGPPAWGPAPK